MKILHVLDHSIPLHSGYTFRSRAISREQIKLGWEIVHLTGEKHGQNNSLKEVVDGLTFYRTPARRALLSKFPIVNQYDIIRGLKKRLVEVVNIENPDIIHAHSPVLNALAAIAVGKKLGIPIVYEIRAFWEDAAVDHGTNTDGGLRYRITRALESYAVRKADAVTTICQGLLEDLIARGIDRGKITVIPNAVDPDQFTVIDKKNVALASKLNITDHLVLGFIGSFYAYEGLDLLLTAVAGLKEKGTKIKCLLVGGGLQDANLRKQTSELGLMNEVIFTGRIPHSDVASYYSVIDILVYPRKSKRITELVTPLKPLEAMAQGQIFMASDVGGHKELVEHGSNGILFGKDRPEAIIEAIERYQAGHFDIEHLRNSGLEFVKLVRNWKTSVAKYETVYKKLTNNKTLHTLS